MTAVCPLLSLMSGVFFLSILQWKTEVMEKRSNSSRITQQVTDRARNRAQVPGRFHSAGMASPKLSSKALTEFGSAKSFVLSSGLSYYSLGKYIFF